MSRGERARQGQVRVAGWAAAATLYQEALERLSDAAGAMLATPNPTTRAALQDANERAQAALLVQGGDIPLLVKPLLFAEHPVISLDRARIERWPVHLFALDSRRVAFRFGENLMVFFPDGRLQSFEAAISMKGTGAAELQGHYAECAKTAGRAPSAPYFSPGSLGRKAEEASYAALYGWRPGG